MIHDKIQLVFDHYTRQQNVYILLYMDVTSTILPVTEQYNYIISYIYEVEEKVVYFM